MKTIFLRPHNISVKVSTNCDPVLDHLKRDFALYLAPDSTTPYEIALTVYNQKADFNKIPPLKASLCGRGFICYRDRNLHYIDYDGKGFMKYDFSKEIGEIYGEDPLFLYEKSRLAILSRVGEILDNHGIHRVHAFSLSRNEEAMICLLPMEGGKTTTALNILKKDPSVRLVAEDTCYIDRNGFIFPFVLRLGARDRYLLEGIPAHFIKEIDRPRYGRKYLIDPRYLKDRISKKSKITCVLIGQRVFQKESTIKKVSRMKCIAPFLQCGVLGLGLPQVVELFVRGHFSDFLWKLRLIFSRSFTFLSLILGSRTFEIKIGRDPAQTANEVISLMHTLSFENN